MFCLRSQQSTAIDVWYIVELTYPLVIWLDSLMTTWWRRTLLNVVNTLLWVVIVKELIWSPQICKRCAREAMKS